MRHIMNGLHDGIGRRFQRRIALGVDDRLIERIVLHREGRAVHHRHRFHRIGAGGGFRRQHHRIRALEHGGGDVGNLRARRRGRIDHGFQHLRGDDHGLSRPPRRARDLLLAAGHRFQRQLHAQIAARHHQRIGQFQNGFQRFNRLGLFDLRQNRGASAHQLAQFGHVVGTLHEGERDPVHAQGQRRFQIGLVLVGHGRKRQKRVGQVHALLVLQYAAHFHEGFRAIGLGRKRAQAHLAVIDQKNVLLLQRGEDFAMRDRQHVRIV